MRCARHAARRGRAPAALGRSGMHERPRGARRIRSGNRSSGEARTRGEASRTAPKRPQAVASRAPLPPPRGDNVPNMPTAAASKAVRVRGRAAGGSASARVARAARKLARGAGTCSHRTPWFPPQRPCTPHPFAISTQSRGAQKLGSRENH